LATTLLFRNASHSLSQGSHLSPDACFALIQFASGWVGIAETSCA
jgi:hypothetical protein